MVKEVDSAWYVGNKNNLMKQAQKMQRQMEEAQKGVRREGRIAAAGGGVV